MYTRLERAIHGSLRCTCKAVRARRFRGGFPTHCPFGENLIAFTFCLKLKWCNTVPLLAFTSNARPSTLRSAPCRLEQHLERAFVHRNQDISIWTQRNRRDVLPVLEWECKGFVAFWYSAISKSDTRVADVLHQIKHGNSVSDGTVECIAIWSE